MKKIFVILFVIATLPSFSQSLTAIQYSMGFGSGDLGTYIGKPSFRGFTLDYRRMVQPNLGVGLDAGWNVFYSEKANDVYTKGTVSYSGKQWRYANAVPLLFAVDYYTSPDEKFNPFFGVGIGTMYTSQRTDMGQYAFTNDAWQFALRPEVGVLIKVKDEFGFSVTGKYYYGFKGGDLASQGYFALALGFVFMK